jgi:hypothetical protein
MKLVGDVIEVASSRSTGTLAGNRFLHNGEKATGEEDVDKGTYNRVRSTRYRTLSNAVEHHPRHTCSTRSAIDPRDPKRRTTLHQQTVGELRESAIQASLRQILPDGFDICSGFVTDAFNVLSPQLDIIVYQRGALSPIFLHENDAIVPVELFRVGIEVKSTLRLGKDDTTLQQIAAQAESLAHMKYSSFLANRELPGDVKEHFNFPNQRPLFVFAYDNEIGLERLEKLVSTIPTLLGVFIIEKCCIMKSPTGAHIHPLGKTPIDRILVAWMHIYQSCLEQMDALRLTEDQKTEFRKWAIEHRPDVAQDPNPFSCLLRPHMMPYVLGLKHAPE